MFFRQVKEFFSIINTDALVFIGMRVGSIILSLTSIILLCRAVTVQQYFLTDGLGLMHDMLPLGPVSRMSLISPALTAMCIDMPLRTLAIASMTCADIIHYS